jgi:hypothetical protein
VKKSTERKRIKRMSGDARRLFLHGLISAASLDKIKTSLKGAEKKL